MSVRISFTLTVFLFGWTQVSLFITESAADDDVVVYGNLVYREGASPSFRLDLAVKKENKGKPRPGIIVIHGGGWIEGDKSSFSTPNGDVPGNIQHFAKLGFVAATMNYRLAGEATFPAALEDCKAAVRGRGRMRKSTTWTSSISEHSATRRAAILCSCWAWRARTPSAQATVRPWISRASCRPWSAIAGRSIWLSNTGAACYGRCARDSWEVRRRASGLPLTRQRRRRSTSRRTLRHCF